jgi:hypothetical protein
VTTNDDFKRIARSLFQLQINTIICDDITGRVELPNTALAFFEIAKSYRKHLKVSPPNKDDGITSQMFDEIAQEAMNARKAQPGDPVLFRIIENSGKLSGILAKRGDSSTVHQVNDVSADANTLNPPLTPEERLTLQKIWEVGAERIVMQSVVHLDGDVVTRIVSDLATQESTALYAIHDRTVSTSIHMWRNVVEVVRSFIDVLATVAFPNPKI